MDNLTFKDWDLLVDKTAREAVLSGDWLSEAEAARLDTMDRLGAVKLRAPDGRAVAAYTESHYAAYYNADGVLVHEDRDETVIEIAKKRLEILEKET